MTRTVILGAGVAGHTAALHLRRMLGSEHEVVVISPNSKWRSEHTAIFILHPSSMFFGNPFAAIIFFNLPLDIGRNIHQF